MKQVAAIMLAGTLSIGTLGTGTTVFAEGSTSLTAASQKESTSLSFRSYKKPEITGFKGYAFRSRV